jgi:hypothetical protein
MKRVLLLFLMTITTIAGSVVAKAQTPTADAQAPFRFELAQADGPRGLGVEGYVCNGHSWRISNVRLRVDSVDASGTVTASASGWVMGDVKAGGRGYFYVPVSSSATTYRATVQSFDKVAVEAARFKAPGVSGARRAQPRARHERWSGAAAIQAADGSSENVIATQPRAQ